VRLGLIGAPTSAGAYSPGQEDAPDALRDAGLVAALVDAGHEVVDLGDVPRLRWRPDHEAPNAMNAAAVLAAALAVSEQVTIALDRGLVPLVVGGDCTVELGTVRGCSGDGALIYVDPHPDLNTPLTVPDGALDWMGMAHMLGVDGAVPGVVDVASLSAPDVLLFGQSPQRSTDAERALIENLGIEAITQDRVAADPAGAARRALEWTGERPRLIHLDTDSIDFADLPLAENTDRNVGLTFAQVGTALDVLLGEPFAALTITEINPHHGEPGAATLRAFIERLATALSAA
jgi:arginase